MTIFTNVASVDYCSSVRYNLLYPCMAILKEQKKVKRILISRLLIGVLSIMFVSTLIGTWGVYEKASLAREQKRLAERELLELEARQADLQAKLGALKTERGQEEEIRQRFSVAKKGESVVVIVDPSNTGTGTQTASQGISGWWKKFSNFFRDW